MVVEDPEIRTFFVKKGFNANGVHVFFSYHERRVDLKTRVYISTRLVFGKLCHERRERRVDLKTRVYISQLPIHLWNSGKFLLSLVKLLRSIILPRSFIQGRRIDTGDRVLIFKQVHPIHPILCICQGMASSCEIRRSTTNL